MIYEKQVLLLKELGYLANGISVEQAVTKFQRENPPLIVDGILGINTEEKLEIAEFRDKRDVENSLTLIQKYGLIGTNQVKVTLPYKLKLSWDLEVGIRRFTCHRLVAENMLKLYTGFQQFDIEGLGLNIFGGCLNVRKQRGGTDWSLHSWGIAVDINPQQNQLTNKQGRFSKPDAQELLDFAETCGFYNQGRYKNFDSMHFQSETF